MSTTEEIFVGLVGSNPAVQGLVGGLVIVSLNLLGVLMALVWRNPSQRGLNSALGFAAGIMLSASFTSLLLPGIERGGALPVLTGAVLGTLVLSRADAWAPRIQSVITGRLPQTSVAASRQHTTTPAGAAAPNTSGSTAGAATPAVLPNPHVTGTVFFIIAIALHNMPEGLAVGVGFGSGDIDNAVALMLAIGVQNIPEGLAVAVSARRLKPGNPSHAGITGARAGLVEIPPAVFGASVVAVAQPLLPYAMGFAAGGMLYIICHEIIPQTHAQGQDRLATLGLLIGAMMMLALDVSLA
ncbi:ZIP family zinc transporter [Halopolyspora algeriensis]|uniref:ZIP family zinc transporter n=1 Tax=Halopolyspora algeriensis TaxID=1500506 RepID=A0A368VEY2_9ACTN|nr:ZIP family metal transporter [Halopolyspora algeriensis]RCW39827.1 ZIP family zinc transporter [Halopolyspora algeriensis]TQM56482.1 ZIP family zinc transporter [Halopolyspora algeriensis]